MWLIGGLFIYLAIKRGHRAAAAAADRLHRDHDEHAAGRLDARARRDRHHPRSAVHVQRVRPADRPDPLPDLPRPGCDDRLRAPDRQPQDPAPRRRGAAGRVRRPDGRAAAGLRPAIRLRHRHHRGRRRSHHHLHRNLPAGLRRGSGGLRDLRLLLHGPGADHPAAHHQAAHHQGGARHHHEAAAAGLQDREDPVSHRRGPGHLPAGAQGHAPDRHVHAGQSVRHLGGGRSGSRTPPRTS